MPFNCGWMKQRKVKVDQILADQDHKCLFCPRTLFKPTHHGEYQRKGGGFAATIDHLTPTWRGGAMYKRENLAAMCGPCNSDKGGMTLLEYRYFKALHPSIFDAARNYLNRLAQQNHHYGDVDIDSVCLFSIPAIEVHCEVWAVLHAEHREEKAVRTKVSGATWKQTVSYAASLGATWDDCKAWIKDRSLSNVPPERLPIAQQVVNFFINGLSQHGVEIGAD